MTTKSRVTGQKRNPLIPPHGGYKGCTRPEYTDTQHITNEGEGKMRAISGTHTIAAVGTIITVHEFIALAHDADQLITRVIARWKNKHPIIVTSIIIYFAGHLLDIWPNDPLTVRNPR